MNKHFIFFVACVIGSSFLMHVKAQENAQTRIPRALEECYRNRTLYERDNRLPSTMATLIRLIRKIENYPSLNMDIKDLAITLVHRFKQDGIERSTGLTNSNLVLPFSPKGYQFSKFKLLLQRLIPANAQTIQRFPNETLTVPEQCSLHFMLSTSIDRHVRGDESFRCSQLAQYRTNRIPRDTKKTLSADVEILKGPKTQPLVEKLLNEDYDTELDDAGTVPRQFTDFGTETNSNTISQCPVENGVIQTNWGAISPGTLLAGIAAGLEPQNVRVVDIIPRRTPPQQIRARQSAALLVDNRWAATLSGDLAEIALLQGPRQGDLQVGAKGAWNSTALPKWYFLSQRDRHEITDAEIRGGLDGLIIAKKVMEWRNSFNGLKLSQVLDMYYSDRGVFSGDEKACKRKELFEKVAPIEEMKAQANSFTTVLDRELTFEATLEEAAMAQFSSEASEALTRYVPQYLNEISCDIPYKAVGDNVGSTISLEARTDIYIFVDTTWPYQDILPVVSDILENLDFGLTDSTYTIFDAQEAKVIVENTTDLSILHSAWTFDEHQRHQNGLNLPNIVKELRFRGSDQLDAERKFPTLVGKSQLALVIPQLSSVSDGERNHVTQQLEYMRDETPDLRLLFLAGGSVTRFKPFVRDQRDQSRDLFALSITTGSPGSIQSNTAPVIQRIKEEPRRVTNYRCGAKWDNWDQGSNSMTQYVSAGGINFYRLSSNYFFRKQDSRKLKIQGSGYGSLSVCHSRQIEHVRQNSSQEGEKWCQKVQTDTIEIDLYQPCSGYGYIRDCPPYFISVEYAITGPTTNFRCNEKQCRNPDDARYVIHVENLGCYSSATVLVSSIVILFSSIFVSLQLF